MKKVVLSLLVCAAIGMGYAAAQESVGGIPWSTGRSELSVVKKDAMLALNTPDFESAKKEDQYNEAIGKPGKYRVALGEKTNINMTNSGHYTYLEDGRVIWQMQIKMPTAHALKLQYNDFQLPSGVTYFVMNGNHKQIVGGYNYSSNNYNKSMAHEMIQGDVVNLEMDINPGADVSKIVFQIDNVYGLYRGAGRVNELYGDLSTEATYQIGAADPCHINAKCPEAAPWFTYAYSVAHIWITDGSSGGFCSGTLINNTAKDCSPLFLTASHCDADNNFSSAGFSQWEFTFGMWTPICLGGGTLNQTKVIKGADFKARSYYTIPAGQETGPLYGDFLLLKIQDPTNKLPGWGLALAGWNRANASSDTAWVSFHHPAGDVMKFTKMKPLSGNGDFNTNEVGTHWAASQKIGGSEGGSSGSGLWEASTGRLLGDLSGGSGAPCTVNRANLYSKIYHNWTNNHDTIYYNDTITSVNTTLKAFLDPQSTGTDTLDMKLLTNPCTVSIQEINDLNNSINIYPNPTSGEVLMKVNVVKTSKLTVEVFNTVGQLKNTFLLNNVGQNQNYKFDLNYLPNGIYLLRISSGDISVTKKIIIRK